MKEAGTVTIAVSRGELSIIADAVFGYGFMRSRGGASSEASALLAWSRELYLKTWEDQPSGGIKVPFTRLGALWEWLKHPLRSRIATGADGGATQGSGDSAGVYGCAERKARMPEEAKMVHPTSQPLPGAAAEDE